MHSDGHQSIDTVNSYNMPLHFHEAWDMVGHLNFSQIEVVRNFYFLFTKAKDRQN